MFLGKNQNHGRGFTLIELAIVLGVVGVLGAGLFRIMSSSNQQTKDQNTAQQQQQLIASVKGFLASTGTSEGQNWLATLTPNGVANLPLPTSNTSVTNCQSNISGGSTGSFAGFCNFLPSGFTQSTTNPYGQTYTIQVAVDASPATTTPQTYSFMIIAAGTKANPIYIPDVDGGRISSMIGGDGGFIYSSTTICGATAPTACGSLGAWEVNATTYTSTVAPIAALYTPYGAIASRTFVSPSADNSNLWLAREYLSEGTTLNTMTTNLYMGTSTPIPTPSTTSTNIYMASGSEITGTGAPAIQFSGTGGGLTAQPALNPLIQISGDLTTSDGATTALLYVNNSGACLKSGPGDATCQYTAQINGDLGVTNLFYAHYIYADSLAYYSSDRRLKKDILPLSDPLADVMKIEPVSFTYKDGGKKSMGVIAQDLEKIYPQLVSDGSGGYKAVAYDGLIAPLIGAVQELKKENDALRAQLKEQADHQEKTDEELAKLHQ